MSGDRPAPPPKPGQVRVVKAMYDYTAQAADELSFDAGDFLYLEDSSNKDWYSARCGSKVGLIPSNYVEEQMEAVPQPMHDSCKYGNDAFLTELIGNKVSVNGLDAAGNTPLHWASRGGHKKCVEILLSAGCQVDVQNKLGDRPLHLAAWRGHASIVELLLGNKNGQAADPLAKNRRGDTPLSMAKDAEVRNLLTRAQRASGVGGGGLADEYADSDDGGDSD